VPPGAFDKTGFVRLLDLDFFARARVPLVLQSEATECGLACIAMLAAYHRNFVSLSELRLLRPASLGGTALPWLMETAHSIGFESRPLRLECNELRRLRTPCILHWRMNHFVVLERVGTSTVQIADPATGRNRLRHRQFAELFTGVALELNPGKDFRRRRKSAGLRLLDLLRATPGLSMPIVQLLALSMAIQVFALAMPAYLQLSIDQVVLSRDRQLMTLLAISFSVIALLHAVASAFRAWCVFYFGTRLSFSWTSGLFEHLLRQPLSFFERRSVGDIQSRFGSLAPLRELVSSRAVEMLVDGTMALTTGIVIVYYGSTLAVIVLSSIALYALLRCSLFPLISQRSREHLVAAAAAESFLLESIRGALPIRCLGIEPQRLLLYRNRFAEALNAATRVRRLTIVENAAELGLFSMQGIATVYVGIVSVLDAKLSVGMLVAFLAYASQFSSRSINLINGLLQFRLIRIHLDRIREIVDAPARRPSGNVLNSGKKAMNGSLRVSNLWFRYHTSERWIFKGISFEVAACECVGISAPSGFGKTTLLKIVAGLLEATRGEVRFDEHRLSADNASHYRRHCGIVMQQDQLLAGSIAQNIAGFADSPDRVRIVEAAGLACIDTDIDALPMQYLTLVGDMGEVFSGGQKQRLLLARALYRRPRILLLDEATSNLDRANEQRIVEALRQLPITRVVIAHRSETLAMCDRIIELAAL
jgi:ATP-binding cassette subfamily B protein RaxB